MLQASVSSMPLRFMAVSSRPVAVSATPCPPVSLAARPPHNADPRVWRSTHRAAVKVSVRRVWGRVYGQHVTYMCRLYCAQTKDCTMCVCVFVCPRFVYKLRHDTCVCLCVSGSKTSFSTPKHPASSSSTSSTGGSSTPTTASGPAHLTLESRLPLAPARATVNSILHLFGGWLVEAALSGVKVHGSGSAGE